MNSAILYQNNTKTITLIDIPRSIELTQGSGTNRKVISSPPLQTPYPSLEPKSAKGRERLGEPSIPELLLQKHIEFALSELGASVKGNWCLPRVRKEQRDGTGFQNLDTGLRMADVPRREEVALYYHNPSSTTIQASCHLGHEEVTISVPPQSVILNGSIQTTLPTFLTTAPPSFFNLILIDPPWPNRSATRSSHYGVPRSSAEIHSLLSSLPITSRLAPHGHVAVWITNKPAFRGLLLGSGGLFEEWGVTLVEEWVWVKVTEGGEPVVSLNGRWRKGWEVLCVGRKTSGDVEDPGEGGGVTRRVIIGVPDLHSRKPGLKGLFEQVMFREAEQKGYQALEIFARNATTGWWAWGDEVLKFQRDDCWLSP